MTSHPQVTVGRRGRSLTLGAEQRRGDAVTGGGGLIPWDDPSLAVASDTARRARYRALQSWWRETHLGVPPGSSGGRPVGSRLPDDVAGVLINLNFLTEEVRTYTQWRVPQIQDEGGTVDVARLRGNLLSSQPLCFNIFGHLRAHRRAAAPVLSRVFDIAIDEIVVIDVEWAPPRAAHLGDRTAFDALVVYRTGGELRFLGIETKYTEPFSATPYDAPRYRSLTEHSGAFRPGAADRLVGPATNQLWRQVLLTLSLSAEGSYGPGRAALLALDGDEGVARATAALAPELPDAGHVPLVGTLERLVAEARRMRTLRDWAAKLHTRYLDLTPVLAADTSSRRLHG